MSEAKPLAGRQAFVLGAIGPLGRRIAVALAEAGATVSTTTLTEDPGEQFQANSTLNEMWALGRAGAAFNVDEAGQEELRTAVERAGENAILVATPEAAGAAWVRDLAESSEGGRLLCIRASGDGWAIEVAGGSESAEDEGELAALVVRRAAATLPAPLA
ncbi:MAG: hypothetical protein WEB00_05685 [Dehalococcoidia bacterium]